MTRVRWSALLLVTAACGSRGPRVGSGGPCSEGSCDDGIDCTSDTCQETCRFLPLHARCAAGTICDPAEGCVSPPACAVVTDCPDLGACSVARCNGATASCSYEDLDSDQDGQPPQICGGADCDDADADTYQGAPEQCNSRDEDCDGQIDGMTETCGTDEGECQSALSACENGQWSDCEDVGPTTEDCDDLDDDCDGETDDGFGVGEGCDGSDADQCDEGILICNAAGSGVLCTDTSGTNLETCDGSDNDCDGGTDEGNVCFPNIGVWCDPADGSGDGEVNPACQNDARCVPMPCSDETDATAGNGMCVVYGCNVDISGTLAINEESCHVAYGTDYVCVDLDGSFADDGEPYNPPGQPDGQNANVDDNVCVQTCVPDDASNPCEPEFACRPDSTRYNFADAVCFGLACGTGSRACPEQFCPVTVSADDACTTDAACNTGAGEFCVLRRDTDDDGQLDIGACAVTGVCDAETGNCGQHCLGDAAAAVGDPCEADVDCSQCGGTCVVERDSIDDFGIVHRAPRNGYCTMMGCRFASATGVTCPAGSACDHFFFAGGCMDLCDPNDPTGCREDLDADGDPAGNGVPCDVANGVVTGCDWYGDYDCWDWGGWQFTAIGLPIIAGSDGQVCDYFGPVENDCENITNSSGGQGCPGMGPNGNPVNMDCRYAETGLPTTGNADPSGRCLDLTGAGDFCSDYGSFDTAGECMP